MTHATQGSAAAVGAVVARFWIGLVCAAVGAAAITGMYFGFTRAGVPATPLRILGSLVPVTLGTAAFYTGAEPPA